MAIEIRNGGIDEGIALWENTAVVPEVAERQHVKVKCRRRDVDQSSGREQQQSRNHIVQIQGDAKDLALGATRGILQRESPMADCAVPMVLSGFGGHCFWNSRRTEQTNACEKLADRIGEGDG